MARVETRAGLSSVTEREMDGLSDEIAALRREVAMLRIANAELERVVVRDTLTPLFNRRHFISCINDRISRASRYDSQAVLMLIDVDNMKGINDGHGHPVGDYVLMHMADLLANAIRASDVACRIGGDEFALILDEMNEEQAEIKMATLDRLVRDTPCRFGDLTLPISASFGCTKITPDESDSTIIARADNRMYGAKRDRKAR